jgi:Mn2+/Fe2+ NRAMP family transporter
VRKLEAFLGTLIAVMAIAFARLFIEARPDPVGIAKGRGLGNSLQSLQPFKVI